MKQKMYLLKMNEVKYQKKFTYYQRKSFFLGRIYLQVIMDL